MERLHRGRRRRRGASGAKEVVGSERSLAKSVPCISRLGLATRTSRNFSRAGNWKSAGKATRIILQPLKSRVAG